MSPLYLVQAQNDRRRVLVTGATGFVGSHVARLLVNGGNNVFATIRPGSDTSRIADLLPYLHVIPYDLTDILNINRSLTAIQPEICLHLAWHLAPGAKQTGLENIESLTSSLNLATRLAALGCQKLVVTGTCFEYDANGGYLSETSAVKPTCMYGASKLGLLYVLEQLSQATGMEMAWLRLFPLYGPHEDERRLVPAVIMSLLGGREAPVTAGAQVRDYLHVEDAAEAILAVTQSTLCGIVNIGSGRPVMVSDVISLIGEIAGRPDLIKFGVLPYRAGEAMFLSANTHRLLENTDWQPRYDLRTGLQQTFQWWSEHPASALHPRVPVSDLALSA